jgi:rhodanese-related sulfurtransferase
MLGAIARAAVLVLGAAVLGLGVNAARPRGVALRAVAAPTMCADEGAPPEELAPDAAAALCGDANAVVADARPEARFAEGHVAGAIHLPCDAAGAVAEGALARLAAARTVVVYGESTEDARAVAHSLKRRLPGARVALLRGGFAAWSQSGQACASGPCDECSARQGHAPATTAPATTAPATTAPATTAPATTEHR